MPKQVTITITLPSDAEVSSNDAGPGNDAGTPPRPLSLAELGSPDTTPTSLDEPPGPMADLPEAPTMDLPTGSASAQQETAGAPTQGSDAASAAGAEPNRPPLPPDPPRRTTE